MRRFRTLLTLTLAGLTLAVLIGLDLGVAFRLWDAGWPPKVIVLRGSQSDDQQWEVVTIPFTALDGLILAAVIAAQVTLAYLVWRAWHSSRTRS